MKSGAWPRAEGAFNSCSSTGKAACTQVARSAARSAVVQAVKAGQCSRAKQISDISTRMGAGSQLVRKAASGCK